MNHVRMRINEAGEYRFASHINKSCRFQGELSNLIIVADLQYTAIGNCDGFGDRKVSVDGKNPGVIQDCICRVATTSTQNQRRQGCGPQ